MSTNEYSMADDLKPILRKVLKENKDTQFSHLSENLFVLRRRHSERPAKWIARISPIPKKLKDLFEDSREYWIEFDEAQFDLLTDIQKEYIVFNAYLPGRKRPL